MSQAITHQPIRAPRGTSLTCKGWQQEAALRILMNGLDPEVCGPSGNPGAGGSTVAGIWSDFQAVAESIRALENDETLLLVSGDSGEVRHTHPDAPRVVIFNSSPAGRSAFSWMHIGEQEALYGSYEMFALAAQEHFQGDLAGKLIASMGLEGESGVLPLAATLNGAAFLGIEVNPECIKGRVKSGYCDAMVNDLDEALRILKNAVRKREAASVGLAAEPVQCVSELARRGVVPDILIAPNRADGSIGNFTEGVLALQNLGSIRATQSSANDKHRLLCVSLAGEPSDIRRIGQLIVEMFPGDENLCRWVTLALKRVRFQGLPARIVAIPRGEHARVGLAINELVGRGEVKAPVVIGAADNFVAFARMPTFEEALALADGAGWVSVEMTPAQAQAAHRVIRAVAADGTKDMATRIERVFGADQGERSHPEDRSS